MVPTTSRDGTRSAMTISLMKLAVKPRIMIKETICITRTIRKVVLNGGAP